MGVVEHGRALVHVVGVVGRGEGHRSPGLGLVARPTPTNTVERAPSMTVRGVTPTPSSKWTESGVRVGGLMGCRVRGHLRVRHWMTATTIGNKHN